MPGMVSYEEVDGYIPTTEEQREFERKWQEAGSVIWRRQEMYWDFKWSIVSERKKAKRVAEDHRQVDELRKRVATLERALKVMPRKLVTNIVKAFSEDLREAGYMVYRGTWAEDAAYHKGAAVTHGGGTWVAVADPEKGSRPGKAPEWRLCAKGDAR